MVTPEVPAWAVTALQVMGVAGAVMALPYAIATVGVAATIAGGLGGYIGSDLATKGARALGERMKLSEPTIRAMEMGGGFLGGLAGGGLATRGTQAFNRRYQVSVDPNALGSNLGNVRVTRRPTPPAGSYRALRDAGLKDSHHAIQDAAVRDLPGYSRDNAPGVHLPGPSTDPLTPHGRATAVQRETGGGTYGAERRIGYKAMRRAGLSEDEARQHVDRADAYFRSIGVTPSTPTRIPGNRRGQ